MSPSSTRGRPGKTGRQFIKTFNGKERPLDYIQIQLTAESFVSEHGGVMNITGVYVAEEERESGIATRLLGEVQKWLAREGYPLCGVDFEVINLLGSPFWHRYFTPYSYTLVR